MIDAGSCPKCGRTVRKIKLGSEPARIVCNRFGCNWSGITAEDKHEVEA